MDCNNFFVSCERIFRPDLEQQPVVVLSNNDGCVVARSAEVKKLGIKMGTPVFQIKDLIARHHITCFSSNFNLYLDISNRIMRLLETISPEVLIYSVDEAFVILHQVSQQQAYSAACRIKKTIERAVGVPVSVGAATSKTLAKIASHYAKTHPDCEGVHTLFEHNEIQRILRELPVGEIWGIGRRLEEKLSQEGFHSAAQLASADAAAIKRRYSVVLWRTVHELNGVDAIKELEEGHMQQQIMWSRSFRDRLCSFEELSAALCSFAAQAAHKLRELKLFCSIISIHIRTSYFGESHKYQAEQSLRLDSPCSDSRIILAAVITLLKRVYRPGFAYAKAGVILSDLSPNRLHQGDLFTSEHSAEELDHSDTLMALLDNLSTKNGAALYLGAQGCQLKKQSFNDKRLLSPAYTTSFTELPAIC